MTQVIDAWGGSQHQLSGFSPMEVPMFLDDIFIESWQVFELGTLQGEYFLYDLAPAVEVVFQNCQGCSTTVVSIFVPFLMLKNLQQCRLDNWAASTFLIIALSTMNQIISKSELENNCYIHLTKWSNNEQPVSFSQNKMLWHIFIYFYKVPSSD